MFHRPSSDGGCSHCSDCSTPRGAAMQQLLNNNRAWAQAQKESDPQFFERLCDLQSPQFLWLGCSDSRVPANQILGLMPGDVFVQRNVGNQVLHHDLNCMSCLEYAVNELKVKTIIVCGHYNCGAIKGALRLPSNRPSLVNHWIGDIRSCRNEHSDELKALAPDQQLDRLCELNVMRQAFHVATSPVVQSAWERGQELYVHGVIYSLKDGLLRCLCGPLGRDSEMKMELAEFEGSGKTFVGAAGMQASAGGSSGSLTALEQVNTAELHVRIRQHTSWHE